MALRKALARRPPCKPPLGSTCVNICPGISREASYGHIGMLMCEHTHTRSVYLSRPNILHNHAHCSRPACGTEPDIEWHFRVNAARGRYIAADADLTGSRIEALRPRGPATLARGALRLGLVRTIGRRNISSEQSDGHGTTVRCCQKYSHIYSHTSSQYCINLSPHRQ